MGNGILSMLDWSIIIVFLMISLFIGLALTKQASSSLSSFFLGGRNLPWYVAGLSMVATTFAADTPLWVTEVVRQNGISANWLWWNMLIGGMLTTFFFARLWRKADVLTELEFIELRYSGKIAQYYRNFKSIYLGVFFNAIIIGWVNAAMIRILEVFLGVSPLEALYIVGGLMVLVMIYSSLSGLLGVAITDAIQFTLAMIGCVILAYLMLNSEQIGGIDGLKEKLPEWQFNFFPDFTLKDNSSSLVLTIGAFLSFVGVQWWASWYPGAEPGGGGYVAQRMMSAKNEDHAIWATLFFQIAHYCLRPWPWIIVALCAIVVYPDLTNQTAGYGFVYAMRDFMPNGLRGLLFTAFLGAYMSTISTQLNWGASYLTNDLFKRNKYGDNPTEEQEKKLVWIGRYFTIGIMIVAFVSTTFIETIDGAARFLIASSAGLGAVLILRWYWWRISIWSEISATIAPIIGYVIAKYAISPFFEDELGNVFAENEGVLLFTTIFATIAWLIVTFSTKPTSMDTLKKFYAKVRPEGNWQVVKNELADGMTSNHSGIKFLLIAWLSSIVMVYSILFLIGKLLFKEWDWAGIYFGTAILGGIVMYIAMNRNKKATN